MRRSCSMLAGRRRPLLSPREAASGALESECAGVAPEIDPALDTAKIRLSRNNLRGGHEKPEGVRFRRMVVVEGVILRP